jgi:hypothetical protein
MKSRLIAAAAVAAALLVPATAGASLAKANQFEGALDANSCGAVHRVTVNGPTHIVALFAATNAGGVLVAQILGPSGAVLSNTGTYTTPSAGTFGVRTCFTSTDGIDEAQIEYVGTIVTT